LLGSNGWYETNPAMSWKWNHKAENASTMDGLVNNMWQTSCFFFRLMAKFAALISIHLVVSMTPTWQFGHRSMIKLKLFTGIQVKSTSGFSICTEEITCIAEIASK
jgi:hypothetical protein